MLIPDHRRADQARELLGTRTHATTHEINIAYRRLVRRLHPDTATFGTTPSATLAEAQAARDLLRSLADVHDHQQPRRTTPRVPPNRGERDIHAGPVRYHGIS